MAPNMSLHSVLAVLVLSPDSADPRLYTKYYSAPHTSSAFPEPKQPYANQKEQRAFEKGLIEKTAKQNSDVILYDNKVVVFKTEGDIMLFVVGDAGENEILLYNVVLAIRDSLAILFKHSTDKRTIIENYDLVALALDEIIDDGIILETDPVIVSTRVSKAPAQDAPNMKNIDLSEQGLLNAWEFGKRKLAEAARNNIGLQPPKRSIMKQRFSSLDVKVIAYELSKVIVGLRTANVYDLSSRIFLLKLAKPGTREQLLVDAGFRCHLTSFVRTTAAAPSHFVSRLRRYLKSRRVTAVSQVGSDRVIELVFSDGQYRLFLEFFAAGNIILTDKEYSVLALFRNVSEGNEEVDVKLGVRYPLAAKQHYTGAPSVTALRVKHVLESQVTQAENVGEGVSRKAKRRGGDELKKGLARGFPEYPIHLLDHAFIQTSFDSGIKPSQVLEDENLLSRLVETIEFSDRIFNNLCQVDQPIGYIIAKLKETVMGDDTIEERDKTSPERENLLYEDFHPFNPSQFVGKLGIHIIEVEGFNKTVDEFYSSLESQKLESRLTERQDNAKRKIESARQQHENRIGALQQVQEIHVRKAEAIEVNAHRVEEVAAAVNGLIGQGMDWMDIAKLIENEKSGDNVVAQMIKLPLKLYENTITVLLDEASVDGEADDEDYETDHVSASEGEGDSAGSKYEAPTAKRLEIDIDLALSAWANARQYYDQKKSAAQKEQKTLQASSRALKSTEQKIHADMKKSLKLEKDVLRPTRTQFWFEKFWYFISSDGYLIIGGKDAQQSELLYRRHLKKGDVYVNADLQGAASVMVKNLIAMPDAPIPPSTLSQAGSLSVCTSTAWDSKAVMAAWWVDANQVSKTAPTGEYLSGGGFTIKGKKNFLPPAQLLLGFSVMFCITEESKANHTKHRLRNLNGAGAEVEAKDPLQELTDQTESAKPGEPTSPPNQEEVSGRDRLDELPSRAEDLQSNVGIQEPEGNDEMEDETSDDTVDQEPEDHPEAANPLQRGSLQGSQEVAGLEKHEVKPPGDFEQPEEEDESSAKSESETAPVREGQPETSQVVEDIEETSGVAAISNQSPSVDVSQIQSDSPPAAISTQSASTKNKGPAPRGKNTKASKRAMAKYAQQDPEERALALELLGSAKGQEKKQATAMDKAARDAKAAADKERRRAQHERAAAMEKKRIERLERDIRKKDSNPTGQDGDTAIVADDDDDHQDDINEQEEKSLPSTLSSLIANPMPSDQILFALPHVAPWSALSTAKYKVKIQPGGSLKKGKAVREIVGRWLETARVGGNRVVDPEAGDREKFWPAEVEAIRAWRLEEVFGCLPVGRMRVVQGAGSRSGGGKGTGKEKAKNGGGAGGGGGGKAKAKAKAGNNTNNNKKKK